jgi:hypothetical protein
MYSLVLIGFIAFTSLFKVLYFRLSDGTGNGPVNGFLLGSTLSARLSRDTAIDWRHG